MALKLFGDETIRRQGRAKRPEEKPLSWVFGEVEEALQALSRAARSAADRRIAQQALHDLEQIRERTIGPRMSVEEFRAMAQGK